MSTKIVQIDIDAPGTRLGQCLACAALVVLDDEGTNAADHRAWHDRQSALSDAYGALKQAADDCREVDTEASAVLLRRALAVIAKAFRGETAD